MIPGKPPAAVLDHDHRLAGRRRLVLDHRAEGVGLQDGVDIIRHRARLPRCLHPGPTDRLAPWIEQSLDLLARGVSSPALEGGGRGRRAQARRHLLGGSCPPVRGRSRGSSSLAIGGLGDRRRIIIADPGRQCRTHCQAFLDELAAPLGIGLDPDSPLDLLAGQESLRVDALVGQVVGRGGSAGRSTGAGCRR